MTGSIDLTVNRIWPPFQAAADAHGDGNCAPHILIFNNTHPIGGKKEWECDML